MKIKMQTVRITKEFKFEGAHALLNYDGKCRHIHGHSYILHVTVKGTPEDDELSPKYGMLIDFSVLKKIVNENILDKFDHALILRENAPLSDDIKNIYGNVITVAFQPTCENLVIYFAEQIKKSLPSNVQLYSLKLYETATSFAEWYAEEN